MTIITTDPALITARLAQMGLSQADIRWAVLSGDAGASASTALHPPADSGFRRWSDTMAALRARLIPKGWDKSNSKNYCTVFNRETRTAVNVMAGDAFTGGALGNPRSQYPKGIMTEKRIAANNQQPSMFPEIKSVDEVVESECDLWSLIQHATPQGVLLELSRPSGMDGKFVTAYSERLLFDSVDPRGIAAAKPDDGPEEPPIDFAVVSR